MSSHLFSAYETTQTISLPYDPLKAEIGLNLIMQDFESAYKCQWIVQLQSFIFCNRIEKCVQVILTFDDFMVY